MLQSHLDLPCQIPGISLPPPPPKKLCSLWCEKVFRNQDQGMLYVFNCFYVCPYLTRSLGQEDPLEKE